MSSIITKPFSWANKIVQAVFKGAPNLITTSDLNRQIEALKKEMYVLQQSSTVIISDLEATLDRSTLTVKMSYVFCLGVKFDFEMGESGTTFTVNIPSGVKELRLYAKKSLITYDDDFSKEISGAKFADGTTQPAANHYVYEEPGIALVDSSAPDEDFQYGGSGGKEYICTLLRIERRSAPSTGYYPASYYIQKFTVPMGKGIVDMSEKYGKFDQFELAECSKLYRDLVPGANDDWRTVAHKLWSRLYTLEKRLFMETLYGDDGLSTSFGVNGQQFSPTRSFNKSYTTQAENFGTCELAYNFHIVGNICFAAGHAKFGKNTMEEPLSKVVSFTIGTANNELPHSLYYIDTACALQIQNRPDINVAEAFTNARGYLDRNKIAFAGIPTTGATFYWYVVYCFSSERFWQYSADDRYGFFDDMR